MKIKQKKIILDEERNRKKYLQKKEHTPDNTLKKKL